MSSFQDLSRPSHMDRTPNNEESLVISGHKLAGWSQLLEQSTEAPQEDLTAGFDSFQDPSHQQDMSQQ